MRRGLLLAGLLALAQFPSPAAGQERAHVRLTLQAETAGADRQQVMDGLVRTLRRRLERLDLDGTVEAAPGDRVVVELPGVNHPVDRLRHLLTKSVSLELRFVRFPEGGGGAESREAVLQHFGGQLPPDVELLEGEVRNEEGLPTGRQFYAVERRAVITGRDVQDARPGLGQYNQPMVHFFLTPEAGEVFGRATEENIGSGMAIVLDGKVMSAPRIVSRIEGEGIIEGAFGEAEVEELAFLLGSGPLPAPVQVIDQQVSEAPPDPRLRIAMIALAALFLLFVGFLVVLYQRGGRVRPA